MVGQRVFTNSFDPNIMVYIIAKNRDDVMTGFGRNYEDSKTYLNFPERGNKDRL